MAKTKKYKIKKGLISQKLDKKTVIFDGERSVLYTLNETASFIFNKLKLGWHKERIIDELINSYSVERKKAIIDVRELIEKLEEKGIIVFKQQPTSKAYGYR